MNHDETYESRHESRITILSHLLEDAGPRSSRATIRRILVETAESDTTRGREQELELLRAAAEQLGVLTRIAWLTQDEIVVLLDQRLTLAAVGQGAEQTSVVLYGHQGGRFSARVGEAHEWLSGEQLWNLVGGPAAEERLPWLVREPYMMGGPVSASAAAGGPATAGGGHGHHGHGAAHSHLHPLARLATFLRPEARDVCIVGLFSVAVGVLSLATPLAVEALVNTVSFGRLLQPLFVLCLLLLAFLGFAAALRTLQVYVAELIQRRLFVRIVGDLAYRLPRVERRAFDGIHAPELLNRFFDVMTVQKSAAMLVLDGMTVALQVLIGMTVLAFYHPALLGFDVLLLASMVFAVFVLGRGAVRTSIEESMSKYAVAAWLEELAQFSNTFKGAGGARHAFETADALTGLYVSARRAHFRVLMRQIVFALGMQAVCGSVLLALGGWLVIRAQITLGQLVAAELIVAVIVGSIAKFGKHMESFYDLLAAVDKIGHLLDLPIERQAGDAAPRGTEGMAVELRDVTYAFESPVFKDLSLSVASGERVALVGPPGSGKSTVMDLLFGLRLPAHGSITIDGADLRTMHLASYRRQVALVRQIEVFSGTIAENVHVHRDEIDAERVREALQAVGLWDEILALPAGAATTLQPTGAPLADNQLRRLMLARAIAGRPRLLLLDGSLDVLADDQLPETLQMLDQLRPQTTVIIATGRKEILHRCRPCALNQANPPSAPRASSAA